MTARTGAARRGRLLTSTEGTKFTGVWDLLTVDEPTGFTFQVAFADQDVEVDPAMPVSHNACCFAAHGGGTRATFVGTYASAETACRSAPTCGSRRAREPMPCCVLAV